MRFWTRRILEIFTIIVGLIVYVDITGPGLGNDSQSRDPRNIQWIRDIYWDEILDECTPGDIPAYRKLFNTMADPETVRIPGSDQVIDWDSLQTVTDRYYIRGGFLAVPGAPEWFQDELDRMEPQTDYLKEILETGPYVSPPSPEAWVNFLAIQRTAKTLQMLAVRDWLHGDKEQAADHLSTIFDLGDAFKPNCFLIAQLIRISLYSSRGVEGFDSLIWTDPGPAENTLLLAALADTESDEWTIPPYSLSFLVTVAMNWPPPSANPDATLDQLAAAAVLLSPIMASADPETMRVLRETGILQNAPNSDYNVIDRMSRWTTVPAMRRRAQRIPESYYASDPWMSAGSAKRLPPLLYLLSRVGLPDTRHQAREAGRRLDVARWKTQAIANAYRVRVFRDEHGRWPTPEEYNLRLGAGSSLDYHVLADPAPLLNRFLGIHDTYHQYPDNFAWNWTPEDPSKVVAVVFSTPQGVRKNDRTELGRLAANTNLAPWVADIMRVPSFVESVDVEELEVNDSVQRAQPESRVTAHLRLPEKSYWVTHPGPDGIADGPRLEYDPTNGTMSRGDIVQLAGWE
jgi:hypothetical protein